MSVLTNEQEQLDAIKIWWRNYGKMTILVFVLGLGLSYAWKFWQSSQASYSQHASLIYDQMMSSFNQQQTDAFLAQANSLAKDYSKTPYANMAKFMLANQAVEAGNLDKAFDELNKIMSTSRDDKIRQIARVRAARVLLAQNKHKEALVLLDKVDNETFLPEINEVKGDVFLAMGETEKAKDSYKAALGGTEKGEYNRSLLEMKFEQLSGQSNTLAAHFNGSNFA